MSCYEWEHGTITLPSGVAPKLREVLNREAEERIAKITADVQCVWEHVRKMTPSTREKIDYWDYPAFRDIDEEALGMMRRHDFGAQKSTWRKPTQKQIRENVVSRHKGHDGVTSTVFHCGEAAISLHGNKVTWDVPENNHACERASGHPLAYALFRFLDRVQWTSRSGGQIVGNNEYNRDNDSAGGGGNYVAREYKKQTPNQLSPRDGSWRVFAGGRW